MLNAKNCSFYILWILHKCLKTLFHHKEKLRDRNRRDIYDLYIPFSYILHEIREKKKHMKDIFFLSSTLKQVFFLRETDTILAVCQIYFNNSHNAKRADSLK